MRDSLTVIIVILIVVILMDGVRRMRLARRDKIRMSRNIYKSSPTREEAVKPDLYTSELPNGGARVVTQRDPSYTPKPMPKFQQAEKRKPEQASLNLDDAVPMLMESVPEETVAKKSDSATATRSAAARRPAPEPQTSSRLYDAGDRRIEPTFSTEDISASEDDSDEHDYARPDYPRKQTPATAYDEDDSDYEDELPASRDDDLRAYDETDSDDELDEDSDEDPYEDADDQYDEDDDPYDEDSDDRDDDERDQDYEQEEIMSSPSSTERPITEPEEVLIINVMATKGSNFNGEELLDILLKCGMRFGDMDIFHRYSDSKGEGTLLFSMANMVKPGTFDLDAMDEFETPGVSLFMTLPLKADSMQSFELMADTARAIAETLDGELKDEQRSVMTRQTIEHCRERIRDFERRRLFSRQR